ncbi:GNAT family N-acetyltransferase [Janibacter alittae]|uniref:GNAT family N-acetyltransferase n=1 Tax=Janibacter alittae TaxID=3115209 RepID=A0ABZ2MIN5_9MICO
MSVIIRPPLPGDETALGPLHNHIWRIAYAGLMPSDYLQARSDVEATQRWKRLIRMLDRNRRDSNGRTVLVAEDGNRLVGFITVGPARDQEMDGFVELMSLYVHPDARGTGVAQKLTDHGLSDGPSYLWVLDRNRRAQAFYCKLGYDLDGATKPHEPTRTTEVRMIRY